jgi:hypothetical protein
LNFGDSLLLYSLISRLFNFFQIHSPGSPSFGCFRADLEGSLPCVSFLPVLLTGFTCLILRQLLHLTSTICLSILPAIWPLRKSVVRQP